MARCIAYNSTHNANPPELFILKTEKIKKADKPRAHTDCTQISHTPGRIQNTHPASHGTHTGPPQNNTA